MKRNKGNIKRLVIFALAAFMMLSAVSIVSVADGSWSTTEVVSTEGGSVTTQGEGAFGPYDEGDVENEYASTTTITMNEDKIGQNFFVVEELPDYWSTTEVVSTESTDNSFVSSLWVDSDGTVHVAWHDHTDYSGSGTDSDIFYKYKPSGGSWSITEVVSTESTGSSEQPSLMVDGDGTVHVAWMDETNYGGNDNAYDVFYKYKPSGGSWSITEVVSTESTNYAWWPSLWVDGDCTVHVAWEDWTNYGGSGSDTDIFYKYKPSGGSWSTTEVVSTESTGFSDQVSLMVDGTETVHVAWGDMTDYGGSGSDQDIFYKCKPSGGSWSTTEVVSTESTGHSMRPSLMVDGAGTVHVAWEDLSEYSGSGSDRDIFYNYKPAGGSWSTTEVVSTESTSSSWSPSLVVDGDGTVHVAWDDGTNYGGSGSDDDIFYKYKPSGGSWSTTEVVSTESTDNSWWPSLIVDGDGTVHVTWQDWTDYGGSGSDRDIFYKYKTPLRANAHGPYYGKPGTPVSFTGSATGGTPPYSWLWDFGDGNTSDEQNPTHIYSTPGNFTLTLTVTDDVGYTDDDVTWASISDRIPDLDCDGSLSWTDVTPGETVTGSFTVKNIGDPGSELDWEIIEWPEWGVWSFDPDSGTGLPDGGSETVDVEVAAPDDPNTEFTGEIKVINSDDPSDYCTIPVYLKTPVNQNSMNLHVLEFLQKVVQRFSMLERILNHQ